MFFGEIVEPTTRALINDEEDYPDYVETPLKVEGNFTLPASINHLIFIDGSKTNSIFKALVLDQEPKLCILNERITIYKLPNDDYIVQHQEGYNSDLVLEEIVEAVSEWLKKAKQTFCFSSAPLASYNADFDTKPISTMRMLCTTNSPDMGIKRLEAPNLVAGLGAAALTYCKIMGYPCTLFMNYMDSSVIDTVSAAPIMDLISKINLPLKRKTIEINTFSSNLYL